MRKAPCINADQSTMQGTRNQDHEGVLMLTVYHGPLPIARRKVILIFPTKSTKRERRVISNAMWPIFTGLEQAQTLLNTCLEEHFESSPQKAITESEAAWLADMLHIVNTSLEDAIASFKLTVGWRHGVEWLEKSTEGHRQVMDLDAIANEISDIYRSLPVEYRGPIADELKRNHSMDDEAAIKADRALLEKVKALYLKGADQ